MDKKQVQQFLKQKNFRPIKKFGQNFLINQNTIQKIVSAVQKFPPPFVEIGPGLGALTRHFENRKKSVFLIEKDKKIACYWKGQAYSVLSADALKLNWEKALPKKFTLFGNLPYEISAGIILKSSLQQKQMLALIVMMQKEVAQRVTAQPCSKSYGLLSVISQTFWDISLVSNVPKTDFYPVPKVDGRVLSFQIKPKKPNVKPDPFLKFVKKCFSLRRKMLFKQINAPSLSEGKTILKDLSLPENCRAEELSPQQFIRLYLQINK